MNISISGRLIGLDQPPYVVAEISANHNGSLEDAKRLISEAKQCGANAVKIQTYRPETITLDSDSPEFIIKGGLWDGRRLYELYKEAHTPWEWHSELFRVADDEGITLFSSPFDKTAVDFLDSLDAPAYKIASFELVDTPLIATAAAKGKPLILSTGMANQLEIADALDAAKNADGVVLLHCVSAYPAPACAYGLKRIPDMARHFGVLVGLSDHTINTATSVASVALGACMIEKHFTLDRARGGPDDSFSLEPSELKQLCQDVRTAWDACGETIWGPTVYDERNVQSRRSLYFTKEFNKGEFITADGVRSVRPGFGLPPKWLSKVIGSTATHNIVSNSPVKFGDFIENDTEI